MIQMQPDDSADGRREGRVQGLAKTLALYLEARARLVQIEAKEVGSKSISILIVTVIAATCLTVGWLLAAPACVWLIAEHYHWHWSFVALVGGGVHVLLALLFFLILRSRLNRLRIFEESISQFKKDRECLDPTPN